MHSLDIQPLYSLVVCIPCCTQSLNPSHTPYTTPYTYTYYLCKHVYPLLLELSQPRHLCMPLCVFIIPTLVVHREPMGMEAEHGDHVVGVLMGGDLVRNERGVVKWRGEGEEGHVWTSRCV